MEITSINIFPMGNFHRPSGAMNFIFQSGRDLEEYMEFISVCHHTTCSDLTFMKGFYSGLPNPEWVYQLHHVDWGILFYRMRRWSGFFDASLQPQVTSVTTRDLDPTPTVDKEPEPTADLETQLMPATKPEPAASQARKRSLRSHLTSCVSRLSYPCQWVLVELEEEEWLR